jgi:hypothetical protein
MNTLIPVLAILVTGTAVAQQSGGVFTRTNYGSIAAPGNRPAPAHGRSDGAGHGRGYRSPGFVAAYPVFIGGYGYGYNQPAQEEAMQPSQPTGVEQPPAQGLAPEPQAVYSNSAAPQDGTTEQERSPITYLIAMKDHTIISAQSYWVLGDTLTYITPQGARKRISLTMVDEQLSKELNDEHNVDFDL